MRRVLFLGLAMALCGTAWAEELATDPSGLPVDLPYAIVDAQGQTVSADILKRRPLLLIYDGLFMPEDAAMDEAKRQRDTYRQINEFCASDAGKGLTVVSALRNRDLQSEDKRAEVGITWPCVLSGDWNGQATPEWTAQQELEKFIREKSGSNYIRAMVLVEEDGSVTPIPDKEIGEALGAKLGGG